jgi:hypothetical protein
MAAAPKVFQFKLVLLGDSAVGKSSLVLRFVRGQFFEYQESTIGGTRDLRRLPASGGWALGVRQSSAETPAVRRVPPMLHRRRRRAANAVG